MKLEDRYYSAKSFVSKLKRSKVAKDALIGAGVGAGIGALSGTVIKGIINRRNGEKFLRGAGKAALIGGGTGAIVGGVANVARKGLDREKRLKNHRTLKRELDGIHRRNGIEVGIDKKIRLNREKEDAEFRDEKLKKEYDRATKLMNQSETNPSKVKMDKSTKKYLDILNDPNKTLTLDY